MKTEFHNRVEYRNDKCELHREDGPAIEYHDGTKSYWINGKGHRENGPAFEKPNGDKLYYINGNLHREDGPAIDCIDGKKFYYLNGKQYSFEDWDRQRKIFFLK